MAVLGTRVMASALLLLVVGCGADTAKPPFDEDAVLAALRPGWPDLTDEQILEQKVPIFREPCTADLDADLLTAIQLDIELGGKTLEILRAGCPERVAQIEAENDD